MCKSQVCIFMYGSSRIRSILIGIKYQNGCKTLDVYLFFAIWMGQIQSKLIYSFKLQACNLIFI